MSAAEGAADVLRVSRRTRITRSGLPAPAIWPASPTKFLKTFLQYDDDPTLKLNLKILGDAVGVPAQDYADHVRRWNVQKAYSFQA